MLEYREQYHFRPVSGGFGNWRQWRCLDLHHSCQIKVVHPEISGVFYVDKVIFSSDDRGFVRTKIFFGGEDKS